MSGHQLMSSSAADGWVQVATFLVGRLFATYCMAAGFQYTVPDLSSVLYDIS